MECNSIFLIPPLLKVWNLRMFRLIAGEIKIDGVNDCIKSLVYQFDEKSNQVGKLVLRIAYIIPLCLGATDDVFYTRSI